MNTQNALRVLLEAVSTAQRKGAYNLQEAAQIWEAVLAFTTPPEQQSPLSPDTVSSNSSLETTET